jgi:hypothetical protein
VLRVIPSPRGHLPPSLNVCCKGYIKSSPNITQGVYSTFCSDLRAALERLRGLLKANRSLVFLENTRPSTSLSRLQMIYPKLPRMSKKRSLFLIDTQSEAQCTLAADLSRKITPIRVLDLPNIETVGDALSPLDVIIPPGRSREATLCHHDGGGFLRCFRNLKYLFYIYNS